jgi:hypothetical protein
MGKPPFGSLRLLLEEIRACSICADSLPLGSRPILAASERAAVSLSGELTTLAPERLAAPRKQPRPRLAAAASEEAEMVVLTQSASTEWMAVAVAVAAVAGLIPTFSAVVAGTGVGS